ncbi:MAG: ketopantoate reductase family protein [Ruminococcaceae bacterium]|nr:ketopantoate reductase family protein [Oscillospiraceae bacterium]
MKVLVVGAGAIGGTVAVLLKKEGYDIRIKCHIPEIKELIEKEGFYLHGAKGEHHVDFKCYHEVSEFGDEKFDIIIIATKYAHVAASAKLILPYIADGGIIVGMQNGILTEELAEIVGRDKAVGCMIGFGATRNADNDVTMTSLGEYYVGMLDGRKTPMLEKFAEMLSHVVPAQVTMDIKGRQYSKLIINSCINAVAGITGKKLGEILTDNRAKDLFLNIAREGMAVAKAMNIKVPKYGAVLEYRMLALGNNKIYNGICKFVVGMVGKLYGDVKPSTLQSIEAGEKTEIDILNGFFVTNGKKYGVPTPVNTKLVEMIHEIERGERKLTSDNLAEF